MVSFRVSVRVRARVGWVRVRVRKFEFIDLRVRSRVRNFAIRRTSSVRFGFRG